MEKLTARLMSEIRRRLAGGQYERVDDGTLFLPREKLMVRGGYNLQINDGPVSYEPNLVVNEGINYLLGVGFHADAAITAFYLGLMGANATPSATWTGANFASLATEFVNYDESVRQTWTNAGAISQNIDNSAAKATFTISTGGGTVYGAGLLSSSVKGGTAGKLISATKFATSRVLSAADLLNLTYGISATST